MFYVSIFDSDPTKSFTNVAFNNLKSLQTQRVNFELRPLNHILNWANRPSWFSEADRDYFTKTTPVSNSAALVHLQISDLLKVPYKSKTSAIGYTAFEATLIPKWICEGINESYRGMIVPSQHCADVLVDSGLNIPIKVVHHALPDMWLKDYPALPEKSDATYVFGTVGNWNSRKNPEGLLRAYLKAFPQPSKDTALLLKTFQAHGLESLVRDIAGQERPDVWIYDDQWSEQQMLWAFNMIDCYVSPNRGEGFGLALAQTAALGKPCLYTNHSAPTEWLGEGHYPLDFNLVKVSDTMSSTDYPFEHIKGPNIRWADVSVDHLAEQLVKLSKTRPKHGFTGDHLSAFRQSLSWESIGEKFVSAMEEILGRDLEKL
jgi:glycosyltransferase involved in cell wall biosynthesis